MSEAQPVRGVVLAHGAMAQGLVDAVARISGVGEGTLVAITNDGKSPEALQAEVGRLLGKGPLVIFADLPSGSCAISARVFCRSEGAAAAVFGVNLPMLLDFVFHQDLPLEELVPRLLDKGRGSVTSVPDYSANAHRTPPG